MGSGVAEVRTVRNQQPVVHRRSNALPGERRRPGIDASHWSRDHGSHAPAESHEIHAVGPTAQPGIIDRAHLKAILHPRIERYWRLQRRATDKLVDKKVIVVRGTHHDAV